jgi:predicted nucleotidyltransferase
LKSLISNNVQFLLVGGYAVNYYGYARATADLDVWIAVSSENARRVTDAVHEFGFPSAETADFMAERKVIRMGAPPLRLEILTGISGVEFADCYTRRVEIDYDGIQIPLIAIEDLRKNKLAAGRLKDRDDLEQLS